MAKQWVDFLDYVMPGVPGANTNLVVHHVRQAVIEFCESTLYWVDDETQNIVGGTALYPFAPPANTVVTRLHRVFVNGEPIDPTNETALDDFDPKWSTNSGPTKFYLQQDERQVRLVYAPSADITDGLRLEYSIKPTFNAAQLENDVLLEEHATTIAKKAKSDLMMGGGKATYADPQTGMRLLHEFEAECGAVAMRVLKNWTRAPARVRGHDR